MSSLTSAPDAAPAYVVMTRDAVVRDDLCGIVAEHDAAAAVIACASLPEVILVIEAQQSLAVAFLELGPVNAARSGLAELVRARRGRLVLLGNDAEDAAEASGPFVEAWTILVRPFTDRTVRDLLSAGPFGGTWTQCQRC